jgi:hypothetical protein
LLLAMNINSAVLGFYVLFVLAFRLTLGLMLVLPFWALFSTFQYYKYKKRMNQEGNIGAIGAI